MNILPQLAPRLYFAPKPSLCRIGQLNSGLFFWKNASLNLRLSPIISKDAKAFSSQNSQNVNSVLKSAILVPRQTVFRKMATHRDLGSQYGGRGSGNQWQQYWKMFQYPIFFSLGFVVFNAVALPIFFRSPLGTPLRRKPEYAIYGLIGLNLLGFLAWKTSKGMKFMYKHGLLHKDPSQFTTWSMLGSAFSHQEIWHVGVNMFVLYQFGTPVAKWIGSERFLEVYLDGAVLSSLGSLMLPVMFGAFSGIPSLGASGAVFTIFGLFSMLNPNAGVGIIFIPIYFPAYLVFWGSTAWNAAGLVLRWGRFDYAGHLAGSAVGAIWGWVLSRRAKRRQPRAAGR